MHGESRNITGSTRCSCITGRSRPILCSCPARGPCTQIALQCGTHVPLVDGKARAANPVPILWVLQVTTACYILGVCSFCSTRVNRGPPGRSRANSKHLLILLSAGDDRNVNDMKKSPHTAETERENPSSDHSDLALKGGTQPSFQPSDCAQRQQKSKDSNRQTQTQK